MDAAKRTFQQFLQLYKAMSPSQRGTLVAVPLMVVAGLGFLLYRSQSTAYEALSWGKVFETEELMRAEQTLIEAGLADFRREGQRIMVSKGDVDRYNAELMAKGSLPTDPASELEKQFEDFSNPFRTQEQHRQWKEIQLRKALNRVLRAVPDIETADVIWAKGTGRHPKVTATVSVAPRRGDELPNRVIQSLRSAVAAMVPDLDPENVVVLNQQTGMSYTADAADNPFSSQLMDQVQRATDWYHKQIAEHLSYIPNIQVTVNVEIEDLQKYEGYTRKFDPKTIELRTILQEKTSVSTQGAPSTEPGVTSNAPNSVTPQSNSGRSHNDKVKNEDIQNAATSVTVANKAFIAAMPKTVQVAVSIPDDYYEMIALKRGLTKGETDQEKSAFKTALAEIEKEQIEKVKATVAKLVLKNSDTDSIEVGSFTSVATGTAEPQVPMADTVSDLFGRWGSSVALGLFALWALWMLNKSITKVPAAAADVDPAQALIKAMTPVDEAPAKDKQRKDLTRRDRLQLVVRDDPELAANVLSKWIQEAK